jgi:hypothetical protein
MWVASPLSHPEMVHGLALTTPKIMFFFFFFLKKKKKKRSFFRDILEGFSLKNSHAILVKNDKLK